MLQQPPAQPEVGRSSGLFAPAAAKAPLAAQGGSVQAALRDREQLTEKGCAEQSAEPPAEGSRAEYRAGSAAAAVQLSQLFGTPPPVRLPHRYLPHFSEAKEVGGLSSTSSVGSWGFVACIRCRLGTAPAEDPQ